MVIDDRWRVKKRRIYSGAMRDKALYEVEDLQTGRAKFYNWWQFRDFFQGGRG